MSKIEVLNGYIGPLVMRQVQLEKDQVVLIEKWQASQQPEETAHHHEQLKKLNATLTEVKLSVRDLRTRQLDIVKAEIDALEIRLRSTVSPNHRQDLYDAVHDLQMTASSLKKITEHV